MKRTIILTFLTILLISFTASAQHINIQARKDSLWKALELTEGGELIDTYAKLGLTYFPESKDSLKRDTLLSIYERMDNEARLQKKTKQQGNAKGNILIALLNNEQYDEVIQRASVDLKELAKLGDWKYYFIIYNLLTKAYIFLENLPLASEHTQKMFKKASEVKSNEGMAMALFTMSEIYGRQGRSKEKEQALYQCVELIKDDKTLYSVSAKAWFDICQSLLMQNRYDELPEATQEFEAVNAAYEAYTGMPIATSWGNLWGVYASWYSNVGEYDKAEMYCNKIDSIIQGVDTRLFLTTQEQRYSMRAGNMLKPLK